MSPFENMAEKDGGLPIHPNMANYAEGAYYYTYRNGCDVSIIDFFHIVSGHAYTAQVTCYFSIICETLQRWSKQILSHLYEIRENYGNCFNHQYTYFYFQFSLSYKTKKIKACI